MAVSEVAIIGRLAPLVHGIYHDNGIVDHNAGKRNNANRRGKRERNIQQYISKNRTDERKRNGQDNEDRLRIGAKLQHQYSKY